MIGHVSTGSSFSHCIGYCLDDKIELTEQQKIDQSLKDGLQHKNRAEVLEYNKCFGNRQELAAQFNDVRKLSKRVEQPVLHLSVRLAPGEYLDRTQLIDIGRALAKDFGVSDNQYISILHKDTNEQHIHLVANRVGYNGKAVSTSNNFLTMDKFCRKLEIKYELQQVLSARRFLSPEQRLLPRHDIRKEKLKTDILQTLRQVNHFDAFQKAMEKLGYNVIKGRGILFIDDKKVRIKGSEAGFSLGKIEKILQLKQDLIVKQEALAKLSVGQTTLKEMQDNEKKQHQQIKNNNYAEYNHPQNKNTGHRNDSAGETVHAATQSIQAIEKMLGGMLHDVMKPEQMDESINPALTMEAERKRKLRRGLSQ